VLILVLVVVMLVLVLVLVLTVVSLVVIVGVVVVGVVGVVVDVVLMLSIVFRCNGWRWNDVSVCYDDVVVDVAVCVVGGVIFPVGVDVGVVCICDNGVAID